MLNQELFKVQSNLSNSFQIRGNYTCKNWDIQIRLCDDYRTRMRNPSVSFSIPRPSPPSKSPPPLQTPLNALHRVTFLRSICPFTVGKSALHYECFFWKLSISLLLKIYSEIPSSSGYRALFSQGANKCWYFKKSNLLMTAVTEERKAVEESSWNKLHLRYRRAHKC